MNGKKSKWVRRLFKNMDVGLILSMGNVYGKDFAKTVQPKRLYRKAKKMLNEHNPATKTWGKNLEVKIEKPKTEGVENG
jgi:hypothetical protein